MRYKTYSSRHFLVTFLIGDVIVNFQSFISSNRRYHKTSQGQTAVILVRALVTTVALAVLECIRADQVWSASCVFQHLDRYVTASPL